MILLASEIFDAGTIGGEAPPLRGIDMTVRRIAFGRQVDSFEGDVEFTGLDALVRAVFIRAPWVERAGDGGRRWPGPRITSSRYGDDGRSPRPPVVYRHRQRPGSTPVTAVTSGEWVGFCPPHSDNPLVDWRTARDCRSEAGITA
jgi:SNO glutamine amidotransferase family